MTLVNINQYKLIYDFDKQSDVSNSVCYAEDLGVATYNSSSWPNIIFRSAFTNLCRNQKTNYDAHN